MSKKKLTRKDKKRLLATLALATMATQTIGSPVVSFAATNESKKTSEQAKVDSESSLRTLSDDSILSTIPSTSSSAVETEISETESSTDNSTEDSSSEENNETKNSDNKSKTNESLENDHTTELQDSEKDSKEKKITSSENKVVIEEGILVIDHATSGGLANEIGMAIAEGVSILDVTGLRIAGSVELDENDWAKLKTINTLFPNITSLDIQTTDKTIPTGAFQDSSWLTQIKADAITKIEANAFKNDTNKTSVLTNVSFGKLEEAGENAFFDQKALKVVDFPYLKKAAKYSFAGLDLVTELNFPFLSEVDNFAFTWTKAVTSVTLGVTDTSILPTVLIDSAGTITNMTLPDVIETHDIDGSDVEEIRTKGFGIFDSLEKIDMPNLKIVGKQSFSSAYISEINAPNVIEIRESAFWNANNLKSINFPELVKVRDGGFVWCTALSNVTAPKLEEVNKDAFQSSRNIKSVSIGIKDITQFSQLFNNRNDPFKMISVNLPNITSIPNQTVDGFGVLGHFTNITNLKMDGLKSIGRSGLAGMPHLEKFDAPNLETIDYKGVHESSLVNINFPKVTSVGSQAFGSSIYENLKTINMENCTTVSDDSFMNSNDIREVNLGLTNPLRLATIFKDSKTTINKFILPGVKEISDIADNQINTIGLGSYKALTHVELPNIKKIGKNVFKNAVSEPKLVGIEMPNVEYIGDYAFYNQMALTSLDFEHLKEVGVSTFSNCMRLKTFNSPMLETVGKEAFRSCKIENIDFPKVVSVGPHAFANNDLVKNINLPSLTSFNNRVLSQDAKLTSLTVGITDTRELANAVPSSKTSLESLVLPNVLETPNLNSSEDAKNYAFSGFTKLVSLKMPKLVDVGDFTFYSSQTVPSTLFDHKNDQGEFISGTIQSAGSQAFGNTKGYKVVKMSNISSLSNSAFINSSAKIVLIPQGNLPKKQLDSFFNKNNSLLGVIYGSEETKINAEIGSSVTLGSSEESSYLYNSDTSNIPIKYQWSKDDQSIPSSISETIELNPFKSEDQGIYKKNIQFTINSQDSDSYTVNSYDVKETAKAPTDPVLDQDTLIDTSKIINGTTVANAEVRITDESGRLTYNIATAGKDGSFKFDLKETYSAGEKIYVIASNEAGTSKIVEAEIVAGAQKPTVNPVERGALSIEGKGKAENVITVTDGKNTLGTGKVDKNGEFVVTLESPAVVNTIYNVYATTAKVDEDHPLDENMMTQVTVKNTQGTITPAEYHVGEVNITGTYTGEVSSIRFSLGGKYVSRGGDFKDGEFTYYCGAGKIKADNLVKLEAFDKNNNLLDTKEFTAANSSEGTITDATYKMGSSEITASYTNDVAKAKLTVNKKTISWGGTFVNNKLSYYVKAGLIKEGDEVTIQAYDKYDSPLDGQQPVKIIHSSGAIKTASKALGSTVIEGTYEGEVTQGQLEINGEVVSKGGTFADGKFNYYIGQQNLSDNDKVTIQGLDKNGQPVDGKEIVVEIPKGEATVTDLSYVMGSNEITGKYEGNPSKAALVIDGTPVSEGGTFTEGSISYYVKADTISETTETVTVTIYDADNNTLQENVPVSVTQNK